MSGQILLFGGEPDLPEKPGRKRYIYALQDGHGSIKIGIANDVQARLRQHQTSTSVRLRLIGSRVGTMDDERKLHALCQIDHLSGEWFKPTYRVKAVVAMFMRASEWFYVMLALKDSLADHVNRIADGVHRDFTTEELETIYKRRSEDRLAELIGRVFGEPASYGQASGVTTSVVNPLGSGGPNKELPDEDVAALSSLPPFASESEFVLVDHFGRITIDRGSSETVH